MRNVICGSGQLEAGSAGIGLTSDCVFPMSLHSSVAWAEVGRSAEHQHLFSGPSEAALERGRSGASGRRTHSELGWPLTVALSSRSR